MAGSAARSDRGPQLAAMRRLQITRSVLRAADAPEAEQEAVKQAALRAPPWARSSPNSNC